MAVVVLATRPEQAAKVLPLLSGEVVREALTTDGVAKVLKGASLVILDPGLSGRISYDALYEQIRRMGVPVVTSEQFLTNPNEYLQGARDKKGGIGMSPTVVAVTSLSGGVGCTTLALEIARWAARNRILVAVVEIAKGASAVELWAGGDLPDVYQVASGGEPGQVDGIALIPGSRTATRLLLADTEMLRRLLERMRRSYVLTLVDVPAHHALWAVVKQHVDRVLVVADPRLEAMENAHLLAEELGKQAVVVLNRAGVADRLAALFSGVPVLSISRLSEVERIGRYLQEGR